MVCGKWWSTSSLKAKYFVLMMLEVHGIDKRLNQLGFVQHTNNNQVFWAIPLDSSCIFYSTSLNFSTNSSIVLLLRLLINLSFEPNTNTKKFSHFHAGIQTSFLKITNVLNMRYCNSHHHGWFLFNAIGWHNLIIRSVMFFPSVWTQKTVTPLGTVNETSLSAINKL
jgi:hypothetical protein